VTSEQVKTAIESVPSDKLVGIIFNN